jgi:hypothetical protein
MEFDRDLEYIYFSNLIEKYNREFSFLKRELNKISKYDNIFVDIYIIKNHHDEIIKICENINNKYKK